MYIATVYTAIVATYAVIVATMFAHSAAAGNPPKVPEGAQRVFMDTLLFWNYPHFLPATGFSMFEYCC